MSPVRATSTSSRYRTRRLSISSGNPWRQPSLKRVRPARRAAWSSRYRREVAGSRPEGADFEVNANGGPRMPTAVHLDSTSEPGFWYVLDRAIAHRSGVTISGPPSREIFADVPRSTLLEAMHECPTLHLQPPTVTVRLRGPVQAVCGSGLPACVRACARAHLRTRIAPAHAHPRDVCASPAHMRPRDACASPAHLRPRVRT